MRGLIRVSRPVAPPHPQLLAGSLAVALLLGACGGAAAPPAVATAGAADPTPAAMASAVRFEAGGLAFDHPASWVVTEGPASEGSPGVIAWLGTAPVEGGVPGPLAAGAVLLTVSALHDADFSILAVPDGAEPVLVDFLPGYVERPEPGPGRGATAAVRWTLPHPGTVDSAYVLLLEAADPGVAEAEAVVRSALDGLMYHPPAGPLPDGDEARDEMVAKALAALAEEDPGFACFGVTGAVTADVSVLPGAKPLKKAVRVECRTTVEATAWRMWCVDLVVRLVPAPKEGAAGMTAEAWVLPDGSVGTLTVRPLAADPSGYQTPSP